MRARQQLARHESQREVDAEPVAASSGSKQWHEAAALKWILRRESGHAKAAALEDGAAAAHRSSSLSLLRKCKVRSRFALAGCRVCGIVRTCRRQRVRDARAQRAETAPDDEVSRRSKQHAYSKRRPKRNCHVASYQFRRTFDRTQTC